MTSRASSDRGTAIRSAIVAFALMGLITGTEYGCRHFLMFWFPTLGSLRVNDMLSLLVAYTLLPAGVGFAFRVRWAEELAGLGRSLRDGLTSSRYTGWIVAAALGVGLFSILDRLAWTGLHLPMWTSAHRSAVWLAAFAPVLKVASVVVVNGLLVPVSEEFLWRGFVQPRLLKAASPPLAIGMTAVCFSLKHAVVDASFGRMLTITALGAVLGAAAYRESWKTSAVIHVVINTMSTLTGLALGMV